jgi:cytochrome d ubiquinol oxidase subunit I
VPNPSGVDGVWMFTATAVSNLSAGEVWVSLIGLTTVYAVLGAVEVFLLRKYIRGGIDGVMPAPPTNSPDTPDDDKALSFAY